MNTENDLFKEHVVIVVICMQLVPGHEVVGEITEVGNNVEDFSPGDRCVADNSSSVR